MTIGQSSSEESSCVPIDSNMTNQSPHHNRGGLQQLLAALSFEHISSPLSQNKAVSPIAEPKTMNLPLDTDETAAAPPKPPPEMPEEVAVRSTMIRRSSATNAPLIHANRILFGTLDPDGHVEDVFYDAEEFGDGEDHNEFKSSYRHESILVPSIVARGGEKEISQLTANDDEYVQSDLPPPPPPPKELPLRFLRAGKGDPVEGLRRYEATLAWRKEHRMDTILREPNFHFDLIKQHYPHFCHMRGSLHEPCFYEQPPKTDLQALREGGVSLDSLLRHYAMLTEFQWQMVERDDLTRSIYIVDLEGMRIGDFAGEVVDFVKKASEFCGQHYPERCGFVYVINVPAWSTLR